MVIDGTQHRNNMRIAPNFARILQQILSQTVHELVHLASRIRQLRQNGSRPIHRDGQIYSRQKDHRHLSRLTKERERYHGQARILPQPIRRSPG
jgi:hypothetical protein